MRDLQFYVPLKSRFGCACVASLRSRPVSHVEEAVQTALHVRAGRLLGRTSHRPLGPLRPRDGRRAPRRLVVKQLRAQLPDVRAEDGPQDQVLHVADRVPR